MSEAAEAAEAAESTEAAEAARVWKIARAARAIFTAAWPEPYLAEHHLYALAISIDVVRSQQRRARLEAISRPPVSSPFVAAARKFLRELESRRQSTIGCVQPGLEQFFSVELACMESAKNSVEELLRLCSPNRPNPALFLQKAIVRVWDQAGIQVGKNVKPGAPLCRATTEALKLAGINYSEDHVSDMLRGRARRPRSGKRQLSGGREIKENAPPGEGAKLT